MSRSEADEMLERKKFPHVVTFSNSRLESIGIYASQIIGQTTIRQANQLKKVMKKDQKLKTTCNPTHQSQSGFFSP